MAYRAVRDWPRYAKALDMRLAGCTLDQIAAALGGISRERARQIVLLAQQQLAYRVFKGVKRPLPKPPEWMLRPPPNWPESQD